MEAIKTKSVNNIVENKKRKETSIISHLFLKYIYIFGGRSVCQALIWVLKAIAVY